jgi:hypothetical protein
MVLWPEIGTLYQPRMIDKRMEHDEMTICRRNPKTVERNLRQYHFNPQKSHKNCAGIESGLTE